MSVTRHVLDVRVPPACNGLNKSPSCYSYSALIRRASSSMAPSRGRKQQADSNKSVVAHPPEIVGNLRQVRKQHTHNLLAILDKCLLHGDYALTAGVCSLAMAAMDLERYSHMHIKDVRKDMLTAQLHINSVLSAVTEVLVNSALPADQVRQYLKQLLQFQPTHLSTEQLTNTIAMQQLLQGDMDAAYRLLSQQTRSKPSVQAALNPYRTAVCAIIRHQQWLQTMREAQSASHQTGGWSLVLDPQAPVLLDNNSGFSTLFVYESRAWTLLSTDAAVRDSWRECEVRLKEALNVDKRATLLTLLLVHLYVVAGRFKSAEEVATAGAKASPNDADALMLLAMVKQLAAAHAHTQDLGNEVETDRHRESLDGEHEGEEEDEVAAAAKEHALHAAYLEAVRVDPLNTQALQVLQQQHDHCSFCRCVAAEACMLHLDMRGMGTELALHDAAWCVLSDCITQLGSGLVAAYHAQLQQPTDRAAAGFPPGSDAGSASDPTGSATTAQDLITDRSDQHMAGQPQSQQQQQQQSMDIGDPASAAHGARGSSEGTDVATGDASGSTMERSHVSDARLWGQVRAELQQRAGWWPSVQLSVTNLLHATTEELRPGELPGMQGEGEGDQGVLQGRARVARSMMVVAAHMLGPLHSHTNAMAGCVREQYKQQAEKQQAGLPETSQQQQRKKAKPFWPEGITWEQLEEDKQRSSPAWLLQALQHAAQVLTAEYHLIRGAAAPVESQLPVQQPSETGGLGTTAAQQPQHGGRQQQPMVGASQGAPQLRVGTVPDAWWTVFPMKRRRQEGAGEQEAPENQGV